MRSKVWRVLNLRVKFGVKASKHGKFTLRLKRQGRILALHAVYDVYDLVA